MRTVSTGRKASILVVSLLIACATQASAQRPANGLSVIIDDGGRCRSEGGVGAGNGAHLSDADLCRDLVSSLKGELKNAGFTLAEGDAAARSLTLHLAAVQRPPTDTGGGLEVQVRVLSHGSEVESLSEGSPLEAKEPSDEIAAVTHALAADMASSPRLRSMAGSN